MIINITWWGIAICIVTWHLCKYLMPLLPIYIEYLIDKK